MVVLDQITKAAVLNSLTLGRSVPVVGFLKLTYTQNTGGAFSLFSAKNSMFVVIAVVAVVALVVAYHRYQRRHLMASAALALALGGAIGNVSDRIRFGYVVDFFDVGFWPVFNVADTAITFAILILGWQFVRPSPEAPAATEPGVENHAP